MRATVRKCCARRAAFRHNSKLPALGLNTETARRRSSCARVAARPQNAREAVEAGTLLFEAKDYEQALALYQQALQMRPDQDEARAAEYNAACAHVRLSNFAEATQCLKRAVNDYNLKPSVVLKDDDLRALRERREWLQLQDELAGVLTPSSRNVLRAEAKAPFRLARIIVLGGLGLGAAGGLAIITTKLVAVIAGAPNAPDAAETLGNFAVNATAVLVLGFLVKRDLDSKQKDEAIVSREEALSRLQINLGQARVIPLARLRGTVRPLVIAGTRGFVNKCLREVARYKRDLQARGVSLIPVIMSEVDPEAKLRALKQDERFKKPGKKAAGFGDTQVAVSTAEPETTRSDGKWELQPYATEEWSALLEQVKSERNLTAENFYIQVQLDGSVRSSGTSVPPFSRLLDDLPPLDSIRTRFTDGVGPGED